MAEEHASIQKGAVKQVLNLHCFESDPMNLTALKVVQLRILQVSKAIQALKAMRKIQHHRKRCTAGRIHRKRCQLNMLRKRCMSDGTGKSTEDVTIHYKKKSKQVLVGRLLATEPAPFDRLRMRTRKKKGCATTVARYLLHCWY